MGQDVALLKLVVAHAAVGVADGHHLEILYAVTILDNNLNRIVARADANGLDGHDVALLTFEVHHLVTVAGNLGVLIKELHIDNDLLAQQHIARHVNIAKIGQRGHTGLAVAVVAERCSGHFEIIGLAIVLASEVDVLMQSAGVLMALINHYLVAQRATAHHLARFSIGKRLYNKVGLAGNNHETHAGLPVAHTHIAEILVEEVDRVVSFLLLLRGVGLLDLRLHFDGLHNVFQLSRRLCLYLHGRHEKCNGRHHYFFHLAVLFVIWVQR